jgi:glutamate-ammonia-ligase adenylyltransferase
MIPEGDDSATVGALLAPCGPVVDRRAAERIKALLEKSADEAGWSDLFKRVWTVLEPVFGASPYLATLVRQSSDRLPSILAATAEVRLADIIRRTEAVSVDPDLDSGKAKLRRLKADLHLLTAICDLGGLWDLDQVTGALTRFADAALGAALHLAARTEIERGRLLASADPAAGPVSGLFCLALGKHGAFELNYSSDIDVSIFYAPEALLIAGGAEPQTVALRLTQTLAEIMQARTVDGYVFRVDLRLRPDPSSTPVAVPIDAALDYYESVGQNWERAAMIKARVAAGDTARGEAFLEALQPFIWRRNLDYAAIADIHSIKRQIHVHKVDERLTAPGANLKLGAGGIREIEFFVQTQQLIYGGRDPGLRPRRTLDALAALTRAGHISAEVELELHAAYERLRALEHRVQMINDEQTHVLPEADAERRRVAALAGFSDLKAFDTSVATILRRVNARYGELFAEAESLSSDFGSLVFTGVDDDPETLRTLSRMGFSHPAQVAGMIRSWHHGRIAATRSERGRELFTRLAPRLLEAVHATGAPDAAFNRFADFFSGLSSGVQVQSLFLAEPKLFDLVVEVMAFAPRLASTLARQPAALDALLDASFFDALDDGESERALLAAVDAADGFEAAMDVARRLHREQGFRIGVRVMSGTADAEAAGRAFADLADACIHALAAASLAETARIGGPFAGDVAIVALGKAGSREMTARSDLDLMTLYAPRAPDAMSELKGWGAETFYTRFTQRLVAALSAPTGEGALYEVDLQLRPSGTAGPVAVSLNAFETYYARDAETWEFLALTRARVVWSSSEAIAARTERAIETALRQPRDPAKAAADVLEMRALMRKERPPSGPWDLKLSDGGIVDIEFAAQYLQIAGAPSGGPLRINTEAALEALATEGAAPKAIATLLGAWKLQQSLSQVLRLALDGAGVDPSQEPARFRAILAKAGRAPNFGALQVMLNKAQIEAHDAYEELVAG